MKIDKAKLEEYEQREKEKAENAYYKELARQKVKREFRRKDLIGGLALLFILWVIVKVGKWIGGLFS